MATSKKYPTHSIGEHIVKFDLVFHKNTKVSEVVDTISKDPSSWPNVEHIFVVDSDNKLSGTVVFKKILSSPPNITLENLITEGYPYVTEHSHQSFVARIALKRGAENIPVVDEENHFVGIVDATEILRILHEEHVEKLMHFSGILASEEFFSTTHTSLFKIIKGRLPWLIIGLMGGIAAAHIIGVFEETLESQLILATFIPLIVYMADAIGTQTETIFVRDLAIESHLNLKKFLIKEMQVGLTIALICGLLISAYSLLIFSSPYLGLVLGLSLFSATLIAIFVGTIVPWFISTLKQDPALGTGPLTTVIQDVASVTVYFAIASFLI